MAKSFFVDLYGVLIKTKSIPRNWGQAHLCGSYCLFFSFIGCSYVFHRDRYHLDKTGLMDQMFRSLNSPVTTKPSCQSDFRRKLRAMQVDTCKFFQIFVLPYLHMQSSQLSYKTMCQRKCWAALRNPRELFTTQSGCERKARADQTIWRGSDLSLCAASC